MKASSNPWLFAALPLVLLTAACQHPTPAVKADFLTANIDSSVSPRDNFFLFANGGWIKRTPIPDEESGWGLGNLVQEEIYEPTEEGERGCHHATCGGGQHHQEDCGLLV